MASNIWKYVTDEESGIVTRRVNISTDKGGEDVKIVHMTDLHFNICTEADLKNEALASTHKGRKWLAEGKSIPYAEKCLDYAERIGADHIVITGDVLDYLSEGAIDAMKRVIWDRFGDRITVTLGNHDATRLVQAEKGTVDPTTFESRLEILQQNWRHDIFYSSRVFGEKVMLIQMDDASAERFWDSQLPLLRADLDRARAEGLVVLLFYHVPLQTMNPADREARAVLVGDPDSAEDNFCDGEDLVGPHSSEASAEIYELITGSADVIKGCFCGHWHNDFYNEIKAKTPDGAEEVIPQYTLIGTPYKPHHLLEITIS